jgi:hypothetical protein
METTQTKNVEKLQRMERNLKPVGIIVSLALGVGLYLIFSSIWIAIFGFIMGTRFIIGSMPKIVFHQRRLYRTFFYLLWPLGGTLILYFVFQKWEIMWLACLLGILGGMVFSVLVGFLFFRDIVAQEKVREKKVAEYEIDKKRKQNRDAVAMKQRFSDSEWEEIKKLPFMIFTVVSGLSGKFSKDELYVWADAVIKPEEYKDPLMRMMLIDNYEGMIRSLGQMDSLSQLSSALSEKILSSQFESLARSGKYEFDLENIGDMTPQSMETVKATVSRGEFRSFINGLVQLGLKVANAGSPANPEQVKTLISFMPVENKQDLFAMLGVEEE